MASLGKSANVEIVGSWNSLLDVGVNDGECGDNEDVLLKEQGRRQNIGVLMN